MIPDRDAFVTRRRPRWERLEALLSRGSLRAGQVDELARAYRGVSTDLARAQSLGLSSDIVGYLDTLASRAHNRLYGTRSATRGGVVRLLARDFPREVRRSWRPFLLASLLFYGPMLLGIAGCLVDPKFAATVLPAEMLANLEHMYSDGVQRAAGEDPTMAGFYVYNNVGIAFRCFATGALGGLGSVFFLVYNGLILGVVQGYLWAVGRGVNLLDFIAGHGPWELTGTVVAGTAGLRLGWALVDTGGRTRRGSLRAVAPSLYRLVAGAAAMLLVAAAIEGFWSATPMPSPVKWAFGAVQVGAVTLWLARGGRR